MSYLLCPLSLSATAAIHWTSAGVIDDFVEVEKMIGASRDEGIKY